MKHAKQIISKTLIMIIIAMVILTTGNNTAEAAGFTTLKFKKQYSGTMGTSDKEYWYKITIPSSGRLTIKAESEIQSFYCFLYTADRRSYIYLDTGGWQNSKRWRNHNWNVNIVSGTYYLCIQNGMGPGSFRFKASFTSAKESFKETQSRNDDAMSRANTITLGKKYKGQLAASEEYDFYRFTVKKTTTIKLSAKANMKWIGYDLYNSNGVRISENYENWNERTKVSSFSKSIRLNKGTYYLAVSKINYNGNYSFKIAAGS